MPLNKKTKSLLSILFYLASTSVINAQHVERRQETEAFKQFKATMIEQRQKMAALGKLVFQLEEVEKMFLTWPSQMYQRQESVRFLARSEATTLVIGGTAALLLAGTGQMPQRTFLHISLLPQAAKTVGGLVCIAGVWFKFNQWKKNLLKSEVEKLNQEYRQLLEQHKNETNAAVREIVDDHERLKVEFETHLSKLQKDLDSHWTGILELCAQLTEKQDDIGTLLTRALPTINAIQSQITHLRQEQEATDKQMVGLLKKQSSHGWFSSLRHIPEQEDAAGSYAQLEQDGNGGGGGMAAAAPPRKLLRRRAHSVGIAGAGRRLPPALPAVQAAQVASPTEERPPRNERRHSVELGLAQMAQTMAETALGTHVVRSGEAELGQAEPDPHVSRKFTEDASAKHLARRKSWIG